MSDSAQRLALFKGLALFRDIPDEQLKQIADRFLDYSLGRGEQLYETGDRAENFYIVLSGLLRCELVSDDGRVLVAAYEEGDPFGARALLLNGTVESRVKAIHNTQVIYLPRPDWIKLLAAYPQLKERLQVVAQGRKQKTELHFDWLGSDEIVRFASRKHTAYLWTQLSPAMALALMGLLAITYTIGVPAGSRLPWLLGGALASLAALGWSAWGYFDWRNDYYVVTDQRVVWVEKVLLRSSSRIEAPLETIQAVNTHMSFTGRLMGYGDIILRTYTGEVLMPGVGDPQNIKYLLEEYIARARKTNRQARHETIRQAVRASLGTAPQNLAPPRAPGAAHLPANTAQGFSLFRTRTVDGDKIIYHKHWFTLFSSLALPILFMAAALYVLRFLYSGFPHSLLGWLLVLAAIVIPVGVLIYRYIDWQNDIYLVTPENLMDSEKKPLGSVVTKSAPLANVLSLENHRRGLGLLFNYGVVRIKVGDSSLDFQNVHNPAQVQQDIFARIEALKHKQVQTQADEERARMTEWLQVYEEERRRAQPPAGNGQAVE